MTRPEPARGAPSRRAQHRDDDFIEFERQSGYAGERAYPSGWRPASAPESAGSAHAEDRARGSQESWRPAGSIPSPAPDDPAGGSPERVDR